VSADPGKAEGNDNPISIRSLRKTEALMAEVNLHEHVIRLCSLSDKDARWHPRVRVFWNEGNEMLEQEMNAPDAITFGTGAEADDYAFHQLALSWIQNGKPRP